MGRSTMSISIHAPHTGRDLVSQMEGGSNHQFQSTRPIRGATSFLQFSAGQSIISIHAPHTGRDSSRHCSRRRFGCISIHAPHTGLDTMLGKMTARATKFQSTRPIRGATATGQTPASCTAISIHAPHTGRDLTVTLTEMFTICISIHAPHTGRDSGCCWPCVAFFWISIHAPHTGRDNMFLSFLDWLDEFQSTRPIRGATNTIDKIAKNYTTFQSTRPIRGATSCFDLLFDLLPFQSTRPIRGATAQNTGDDAALIANFNPRAPYGARLPAHMKKVVKAYEFQSTRPIRGATLAVSGGLAVQDISIHAPHTGRDQIITHAGCQRYRFQSTRPIRGATFLPSCRAFSTAAFQSTRPIRGATIIHKQFHVSVSISIHAPHTGRDTVVGFPSLSTNNFNPRAPYGARRPAWAVVQL